MRKSRFTESQIIGMITEQGSSVKRSIQWINRSENGLAVAEVCRKHGQFLQAESQVWRHEGF